MCVFVYHLSLLTELLLSEEQEEDDEAFSTRSTMLGPAAVEPCWSVVSVLLVAPATGGHLGGSPLPDRSAGGYCTVLSGGSGGMSSRHHGAHGS